MNRRKFLMGAAVTGIVAGSTVLLADDIGWPAAGVHVVLAQDLEPVDLWMVLEDVREMDGPQADSKSEIGVAPTVHGKSILTPQ